MKAADRRDIQKPDGARGTVPVLIAYDGEGAPSRTLLATRKQALPLPGVPGKVVVRTRGRAAQAHADIEALRAALLGEQLATPRDGAEPEVWPPEPRDPRDTPRDPGDTPKDPGAAPRASSPCRDGAAHAKVKKRHRGQRRFASRAHGEGFKTLPDVFSGKTKTDKEREQERKYWKRSPSARSTS
jgi:hypothetical protein